MTDSLESVICERCGVYIRLSREESEKNSIQAQQIMARQYIDRKPELLFVREYVDIGYSGANFNRPAMRELLADIADGKIDCIIVKDLSRLGRNFSLCGRFIEDFLQQYKVHFISLLDHFDNRRCSEIQREYSIPFINIQSRRTLNIMVKIIELSPNRTIEISYRLQRETDSLLTAAFAQEAESWSA